mmetsp:Transcript_61507/g.170543  ORF Transcript_61507/g.170543 Transcript_61507/m.170543 type:complete len:215 (+) Transcript_61507:977-1621(+)
MTCSSATLTVRERSGGWRLRWHHSPGNWKSQRRPQRKRLGGWKRSTTRPKGSTPSSRTSSSWRRPSVCKQKRCRASSGTDWLQPRLRQRQQRPRRKQSWMRSTGRSSMPSTSDMRTQRSRSRWRRHRRPSSGRCWWWQSVTQMRLWHGRRRSWKRHTRRTSGHFSSSAQRPMRRGMMRRRGRLNCASSFLRQSKPLMQLQHARKSWLIKSTKKS